MDYVAGWFYRAAQLMQTRPIEAAFVATNSITQGEQVASLWKDLIELYGIHINFAWRTFRWDSEAADMAHVHCVIIGFSTASASQKFIFDGDKVSSASNINAYLTDAPNVFVEPLTKPICPVSEMQAGGKPTENGNLILCAEDRRILIDKYPNVAQYIRPFMMGKDFIDRKPRYCLWFADKDSTKIIQECPEIRERIEAVKVFRLSSKKIATRRKANTPWLFDEIRPSITDYIAIPKVSSERRKYIPIEKLSANVIAGDNLFMVPNATAYEFGILTSSTHMAWMRAVAGRLKSDYRYSNKIVYNDFVWPATSEDQEKKIEQTAQAILDARAQHPEATLADLYDELTMPPDLRKAHQANDRAVLEAYGLSKDSTEEEIVAHLMKLYSVKVEELKQKELEDAARLKAEKAAEKKRRKAEQAAARKH